MRFDIGAVLQHYGAAPITPRSTTWTPVRCPFHEDRSPSAAINAVDGRFHCFVCGIHEDAVGLIMEREHVNFQTALAEAESITGESAEALCDDDQLGGWFPVRQRVGPRRGDPLGPWRSDLATALA